MGRRPDPDDVQAAKGAPGKRMSKAARQLLNAERLAGDIAAAPSDQGDPLAPPKFLDARAAPALQVWREHAPKLQAIHLLEPLFRHVFAMFCVYVAEFYQAHEHVLANGHTQRVKTIAGGYMLRRNPMLDVRDAAAGRVLEYSKRFGFSPMDQVAIFKDHASAASAHGLGGLFGQPAQRPSGDDDAAPMEAGDPVGELGRHKRGPPGPLN